ncbi:MAG: sulfatase-like hydrolase/transferase [Planctomycetota bacterium]|nr:sulfatase-like hydrolase/transferase [Planctomycetota bacterium]
MKTFSKTLLILLLFETVLHAEGPRSEPTPGRPNILFIVSDDHGWGDLPSNWDKTEVQLPSLEALVSKGVRFSNYHTVPLCGPSRACMFTGQFSTENGMWRGPGQQPLGSPGYRGIKRDVKMLAEYLSEAGYKTGAFGKWHMGALPGEVPNDRGFEEFHGFLAGSHPYWIKPGRSKIMHSRRPDQDAEGHATELFTNWAEDFIRSNAKTDSPFFCYLAYNAVHGPLRVDKSKPASAPEIWVNKALDRGVSFLRSDYVAILEHMDHNIGRLIDLLSELNVADNTLIVFVSDNGGCTMEEGAAGGRYPGNNGPHRGGKATTYQGGLNVPFVMNWKGRLPQGIVADAQVMHCDVFATLLDAAEISVPKSNGKNPVRGMSLLPYLVDSAVQPIPERTMVFELWGNIGVRKGNYKLWSDVGRNYSPDWPALAAELERTDLALYDLSKDSAEEHDLRTKVPEVYAEMKKELLSHLSQINSDYSGSTSSAGNPEKSKSTKNKTDPEPSKRPSRDQFFRSRDRNSDGFITLKEFIGNPKGRDVPALTKRFGKLDRDGDGKLQREEIK